MRKHNVNLRPYNTFALNVIAKELIHICNENDLECLTCGNDVVVLGGGSNVVFVNERIEKPVLHIENKGIAVVEDGKDYVIIDVAAGEKWSEVVQNCCEKWWCGIENLAAIYGTAGAAPVQNIGAYGVEIKDFVESVLVFDLTDRKFKTYINKECDFGYRFSRFKYGNKHEIIWKLRLKLQKNFIPNLSYRAVSQMIGEQPPTSPIDMCNLVTAIRNSKLPNPQTLPNVGSFFKNPVISTKHFDELAIKYPNLVSFPTENEETIKLSAAFLIEKAGWKGKRLGSVGMHSAQALVMVAYEQTKGSDIVALAAEIKNDVKKKFNVNLEIEAHIIV